MTALAVGVQVASLYQHVDGINDVRRALGVLGVRELAEAVRGAAMGGTGDDGLVAMAVTTFTGIRVAAWPSPGWRAAMT
jgi:hypothetical protein